MAQDERGDLRRCEFFIAESYANDFAGLQVLRQAERKQPQLVLNVFDTTAHEALNRIDGALGRFDQVDARGIADDGFAILVESDDRGHQIRAVLARNDDRESGVPSAPGFGVSGCTVAFHVGYQRIRGAEVNTNDAFCDPFSHFDDGVIWLLSY